MTPKNLLSIDRSERASAFDDFVQRHRAWVSTTHVDELRARDYARLDENDHVYLDYTGGGLYAESQVRAHSDFMAQGVFGNPHSGNPASLEMTDHVERARSKVLEFFNADPDEYTAIFTQNASGALKLVGESYPFREGGRFVLTADNHNSVNGIREFAGARRAQVTYAPLEPSELRIDRPALMDILDSAEPGDNLFAFPAQSNYTGVKHPLDLVGEAQARGWDVLLDAAAFAPTSRLDLSIVKPEYVALSFYKIFGYPTGVGALLVRNDALAKLERPWFGGGTIQIVSVAAHDHHMAPGPAAFEDGTVNYLTIPAVQTGLEQIERIGIDTITTRVACLTGWLLEELTTLEHGNGRPMVKVLGPPDNVDRGGTVTVSLFDPNGVPYSGARIEELAGDANVSVRTGCFCNPGAGEAAMGLSREFMMDWFRRPTDISFYDLVSEVRSMTGQELSAIRISVGLASNFNDLYYLMRFLDTLRDRCHDELGQASEPDYLRDTA